jgi:hypothetical protein
VQSQTKTFCLDHERRALGQTEPESVRSVPSSFPTSPSEGGIKRIVELDSDRTQAPSMACEESRPEQSE